MVSNSVRYSVWGKYYSVTKCVHFYTELSGLYTKRHNWIRFALLIPMLSGFSLLIEYFSNWLENYEWILHLVIGLSVSVLAGIELICKISEKSIMLNIISVECCKLEDEWSELWLKANSDNADEMDIIKENFALSKRFTDITCNVDDAIIRKFKKLNDECEKFAYKLLDEKNKYV